MQGVTVTDNLCPRVSESYHKQLIAITSDKRGSTSF